MFNWITNNKEWLFSGAGGTILVSILGYFINFKRKKSGTNIKQSQTSGNNSTNIQSSGNINIKLNEGSSNNNVRK